MRGTRARTEAEKRRQARRRRPTREEIRKRREKGRARRKALKRQALIDGLCRPFKAAQPNRVSSYASQAEEEAERQRVVAAFIDSVRPQLPAVMRALGEIDDPRDPKKIEHELALVLFYGMMCFVFQVASRREANRELSGPVLLEHLRQLFPEIEKLPHQDTVNRVLAKIEVEEIQELHLQMIRRLVRNKKLDRFLVNDCYPVAMDGTQKLVSKALIGPEWQERTLNQGTEAEKTQYYVYVLEATLAFANGMTLPLLTEFLNYEQGDTDNGRKHQKVHVVECQESWDEIDPETGGKVAKKSRHVWISSEPLNKSNLHTRCNLAARHRWNIEEGFLAEKRQGYQYEHRFSLTWQAMKGYHYLMHLGHALNVLAQYSEALIEVVRRMGVRPFIKYIRDSLVHPWLNPVKLREALAPTAQLRLA